VGVHDIPLKLSYYHTIYYTSVGVFCQEEVNITNLEKGAIFWTAPGYKNALLGINTLCLSAQTQLSPSCNSHR
jgi:hypothetical protein